MANFTTLASEKRQIRQMGLEPGMDADDGPKSGTGLRADPKGPSPKDKAAARIKAAQDAARAAGQKPVDEDGD